MSNTTEKIPLSERINMRMMVFWVVIGVLVGIPAYIYVESVVTGGVRDRGEYLEVDFRAMVNFPFDQETGRLEDVPERWRSLDGRRIMLVGEMWAPQSTASQLGEFELVYSIAECCYGGPPQIQHFVQSRVVNGGTVNFYSGLVRAVGTLHVDVQREGGQVVSVYRFDVESVDPLRRG